MSSSNKSQKIKDLLMSLGVKTEIKEFPQSTRTAQEAADAISCTLGQISKSIIFKGKSTGNAILVIASGSNRVDEKKVKNVLGENLEKADATFVLEKTGYIIGGVPPLGHTTQIIPLIDEDLMQYKEIWAAAGTPHTVFKLTPQDLVKITSGGIENIKQD